MSGDAIWRGNEEMHEARRAVRSTYMLRRVAKPGRGEAEEGRGVSGDAIWREDEETHEAWHAARLSHSLRRGAERGRGEAEEGHSQR